jgi:hypothetical protein
MLPPAKRPQVYTDGQYVYDTDGQYVYDPRLSLEAIPKDDWEIMIRSLNPGAVFK